MHPQVAFAMAHARRQDLRQSAGQRRSPNDRPVSPVAGRRWRLLAGLHHPLVSHRTRLGH